MTAGYVQVISRLLKCFIKEIYYYYYILVENVFNVFRILVGVIYFVQLCGWIFVKQRCIIFLTISEHKKLNKNYFRSECIHIFIWNHEAITSLAKKYMFFIFWHSIRGVAKASTSIKRPPQGFWKCTLDPLSS